MDTRVGNVISAPVPNWLDKAKQYKSTSGNQAVYNYRIKEMFALAKYGCCCCLEERTWIAVIDILELLHQAKENYSTFQVQGWERPTVDDQARNH
jgi:hypothetical protein